MKILVTGGAGFIGSNFVRYWFQHHPDDEIVNFDKLTYAGTLTSLQDIEKNPHYQFIQGDICDPESVKQAMAGVDTVVHFAAETHVDRSITGPAVFMRTNVIGTQVLLEAALSAKVGRFHHVSTDEVYGSLDLDTEEKFMIDRPYQPRSPYAASKAAADHLVRAYWYTYQMPITITNCSNNFGPYQFPEKVIPLFVTNLIEGKKVPLYGDGKNVRDWLYVVDHCTAIELVLAKGRVGETYLVGADNEVANITLAKKILALMGKDDSWIEPVADRLGHDRRYAIDGSKIRDELGWKPQFDFETSLSKTVQWYQDNKWWWEPLKK